jgi:hypothetical protein
VTIKYQVRNTYVCTRVTSPYFLILSGEKKILHLCNRESGFRRETDLQTIHIHESYRLRFFCLLKLSQYEPTKAYELISLEQFQTISLSPFSFVCLFIRGCLFFPGNCQFFF